MPVLHDLSITAKRQPPVRTYVSCEKKKLRLEHPKRTPNTLHRVPQQKFFTCLVRSKSDLGPTSTVAETSPVKRTHTGFKITLATNGGFAILFHTREGSAWRQDMCQGEKKTPAKLRLEHPRGTPNTLHQKPQKKFFTCLVGEIGSGSNKKNHLIITLHHPRPHPGARERNSWQTLGGEVLNKHLVREYE